MTFAMSAFVAATAMTCAQASAATNVSRVQHLAQQCDSEHKPKSCRELIDIAEHDKTGAVRLAAVKSLKDASTLATLALKDVDETIRQAAFDRYAAVGFTIRNANGVPIGAAIPGNEETLLLGQQYSSSLPISLLIRDLPPGEHEVSINQYARCDGPQFMSAGGHFDPKGSSHHGSKNSLSPHPHFGDLGNVTVDGSRQAVARVSISLSGNISFASLLNGAGAGPNSSILRLLLNNGGGALIISSGPDDFTSDPDGNAGDRIACGLLLGGR